MIKFQLSYNFPKATNSELTLYNEYIEFLESYGIKLNPVPTGQLGFSITQDDFFKWLDLTMLLSEFNPNFDEWMFQIDPKEYRKSIQHSHVDHIIDLILWAVDIDDKTFKKPYEMNNETSDLIFNHKFEEIFLRLFYPWIEFMDNYFERKVNV